MNLIKKIVLIIRNITLERSQLANWNQQKGYFYCVLNRKSYEENHLKST